MADGNGRGWGDEFDRMRKVLLDLEHVINADSHGYHREIARHLEEIHREINALESKAACNPP